MELREEQVQIVKKGEEEGKNVSTTLALFGGNHRWPMPVKTEGKSRCKTTDGNGHTKNK